MRGHPLDNSPPSVRHAGKPAGGHLPPHALARAGEESQGTAAKIVPSQHPAPKVLMGEVMAPKGQMIAAGREAFRAFMRQQRLTPTVWARMADVPAAQILAFLAGQSREIPRVTLEKLAAAAGTTVDALLPE